eukprot:scaffold27649_cov69-Phaeocystis_antarctica.AAC.2
MSSTLAATRLQLIDDAHPDVPPFDRAAPPLSSSHGAPGGGVSERSDVSGETRSKLLARSEARSEDKGSSRCTGAPCEGSRRYARNSCVHLTTPPHSPSEMSKHTTSALQPSTSAPSSSGCVWSSTPSTRVVVERARSDITCSSAESMLMLYMLKLHIATLAPPQPRYSAL